MTHINMSPAGHPNKDEKLIAKLISDGISKRVVRQLIQAFKAMNVSAKTEEEKDKDMRQIMDRPQISQFGVQKRIKVSIEPGFFSSGDKDKLPVKIIITPNSDGLVSHQPSWGYLSDFLQVSKTMLASDINGAGLVINEAYARETRLHKERHGIKVGEEACMFRMLDEDHVQTAEAPFHIFWFGWKCGLCGFRHEMDVYTHVV
jgi:hypothetical protein